MAYSICRVLSTGLLLVLSNVEHTRCLELSWTQYSDRASLPQSLHARQELRSSLDHVRVEKLPGAQKAKVRELKRLLDEVLAESSSDAEAAAIMPGTMRLGGTLFGAWFCLEHMALLAFLFLLGACVVRLSKPAVLARQAKAADAAAAKEAASIVTTEQNKLESKSVLKAIAVGHIFPEDVAQAICSRIISVLQAATKTNKKKPGKEPKSEAPLIDTRQLGMQLALHYELPEVEVVDKALRKEKKKLRQTVQTLQNTAQEAVLEATKAAATAADLKELQKKAEDAKQSADAKKGPKNKKKGEDVLDSTKFADNAAKAAADKAADAEKAQQAVHSAKAAEYHPNTLRKMECAWLGAVTQAWSHFASKLGGSPTPSHMHAWARDQSLRQVTELAYIEIVSEKGFLD